MRLSYQAEFEANFEANQADKNNHLQDAQNMLIKKEEEIKSKSDRYKELKELNQQLLLQKYRMYLKRVAFRAIEYQTQEDRRMRRAKIYSKNYIYRRKLRLLFGSWRGVTH